MKTLHFLALIITAALPSMASAQLRFEGGQVSVSGFVIHEYLIDPFDQTFLINDYFDELEASLDIVYSFGNFGLQAGAHIGSTKWRDPNATAATHYGVNLHSYYISQNGNKFGAVLQYLDMAEPVPASRNTKLIGLESMVSFGAFDLETSISTYSTFHSESNVLATAHLYVPIAPSIEISAGYSYREFDAIFPINQYSIGVEYSLPNSRFGFSFDYAIARNPVNNYNLFQFGLNYRFGSGNTGRLFSDRTSGYGRFSV